MIINTIKLGAQDIIKLPNLTLISLICLTTTSIAGTLGIQDLSPTAANWSGFNIGINGGFSWSNAHTQFKPLPGPSQLPNGDGGIQPSLMPTNMTGGIFGFQIGYNWLLYAYPNLYLGLETDMDWSSLKGTAKGDAIGNDVEHLTVFNNVLSTQQKSTWFGSLRGRLGFSPISSFLLYGAGGLAYGSMQVSANTNFIPGGYGNEEYPAALSLTLPGWAAGGGLEWALKKNWSVKFEYLYYNLGSVSEVADPIIPNPPFQTKYTWSNPVQLIRIGLNYHFS